MPFIQVHEFEALLYSDVSSFSQVCHELTGDSVASLRETFEAHLRDFDDDPEAINDDPMTAPSKRIVATVRQYRKPAFGVAICRRIGLPTLRARCRHFDSWVQRLEALAG